MRARLLLPATLGALLLAPASASAMFAHTIMPGESLSSIAAVDGLSVNQLAAANGLSPNAMLTAGSTLSIPPQGSGSTTAAAPASTAATQASSAAAPSSAGSGNFPHTVMPGESLSSVAAVDGLSVDQLAAANGLSPNAMLTAGSTLFIPPQGSGSTFAGAPASAGSAAPASAGAACDGDNDSDDVGCASTGAAVSAGASSPGGSYVVQPGDTLSGIAAREGMSVAQLAALNGLDLNGILPAGSVLTFGGGGGGTAGSAAGQPVGVVAEGSSSSPPYPTPESVTSSEIGQIAAANGVPPSLASAIAWQESGFNNDAVSSADARGVMQILPGTWNWIQHTLVAGMPPLDPASAADNVRGGVLLLRSLLNSTGGNQALAAAGYYQGLPSVQQNGLYPSTQQYVNDVLALQQQFGGG